jgi:dihydrofolate reductase
VTKTFVSVTMSLDGFLAPPGRMEELRTEGESSKEAAVRDALSAPGPGRAPLRAPRPADGDRVRTLEGWMHEWSALQSWVFPQRFFRANLKLGEGGETGEDDKLLREVFARTGVTVLGKRMFDGGEKFWPEEAPFHTPVFVVTHEKRAPWVRPGGTTFHFVNDGVESAVRQARAVCPPGKEVRIGGGADTIDQCLRAGLVDELNLAIAPLTLGRGVRALKDIPFGALELTPMAATPSTRVTHVRYGVRKADDHSSPKG